MLRLVATYGYLLHKTVTISEEAEGREYMFARWYTDERIPILTSSQEQIKCKVEDQRTRISEADLSTKKKKIKYKVED